MTFSIKPRRMLHVNCFPHVTVLKRTLLFLTQVFTARGATVFDKWPQLLLRASSPAASAKITTNGIPDLQNCCVAFRVYIKITNVAAGLKSNLAGHIRPAV